MSQGTLWFQPIQHAISSSLTNVSGAKAYFYLAGTTTLIPVYTNVGLTIPHTQPVVADGSGVFAEIFLTPGTAYKVDLQTSAGVSLPGYPADNQLAIPASSATVDSTETAGEALTAGQAAYLSDGSGGKTAGQLYKTDTTNTYSSTTPLVGMVTSAIAAGTSGIFRTDGVVTGLSGLTVGQDYYLSTAGALTSTAPVNARWVGRADSTSSIVIAPNPPPGTTNQQLTSPLIKTSVLSSSALFNGICQGRLTLTSGTPVTTADVTGATTIYWTPYGGRNIALYDGSANWTLLPFVETSISLGTLTSGLPYDVFAYNNSGTLALELLAWTSGSARATALVLQDGVYVKTGATTRRYLGSFYTTSTTQTEDSFAKRNLWNYYNRVERVMRVIETTDSWQYQTNTYRQARSTASNQLEFLIGVAEVSVDAQVIVSISSNSISSQAWVAIGEDSTTTADTNCLVAPGNGFNTSIEIGLPQAFLKKYPLIGRHLWVWLEKGLTGTITWYGDAAADGTQSGIHGSLFG